MHHCSANGLILAGGAGARGRAGCGPAPGRPRPSPPRVCAPGPSSIDFRRLAELPSVTSEPTWHRPSC